MRIEFRGKSEGEALRSLGSTYMKCTAAPNQAEQGPCDVWGEAAAGGEVPILGCCLHCEGWAGRQTDGTKAVSAAETGLPSQAQGLFASV